MFNFGKMSSGPSLQTDSSSTIIKTIQTLFKWFLIPVTLKHKAGRYIEYHWRRQSFTDSCGCPLMSCMLFRLKGQQKWRADVVMWCPACYPNWWHTDGNGKFTCWHLRLSGGALAVVQTEWMLTGVWLSGDVQPVVQIDVTESSGQLLNNSWDCPICLASCPD